MHYFHQNRFQPKNSSSGVKKIKVTKVLLTAMQISHHPSHQEPLCSPHSEGSKVDCTPILNRHLALAQTQSILQHQLYTHADNSIGAGLFYLETCKQDTYSFTGTITAFPTTTGYICTHHTHWYKNLVQCIIPYYCHY